MKKLLTIFAAIILVFSLASCKKNEQKDNTSSPVNDMALSDIMAELYKGIDDLPKTMDTELTKDNFESYTFVEYRDGYTGLASEAMIGSIAHSVVLVRLPDEETAKTFAKDMEKNVNPRKWICVEAEKTGIMQSGNTVLLVLSFQNEADAILNNFGKLTGEKVPEGTVNNTDSTDGEAGEMLPLGPPVYDPETDENNGEASSETSGESTEVKDTAEAPSGQAGTSQSQKPQTNTNTNTNTNSNSSSNSSSNSGSSNSSKPQTQTPQTQTPQAPVTETPETPAEEPVVVETDLRSVMDKLYTDVEDMPRVGTIDLDDTNFKYYAFTDFADGYKAVCSEAMMNAIAHSVVLVEVPEGVSAQTVADAMKENANPRKWVCVEAESVQSAANGNLAILVMTSQDGADQIIKNFKAL